MVLDRTPYPVPHGQGCAPQGQTRKYVLQNQPGSRPKFVSKTGMAVPQASPTPILNRLLSSTDRVLPDRATHGLSPGSSMMARGTEDSQSQQPGPSVNGGRVPSVSGHVSPTRVAERAQTPTVMVVGGQQSGFPEQPGAQGDQQHIPDNRRGVPSQHGAPPAHPTRDAEPAQTPDAPVASPARHESVPEHLEPMSQVEMDLEQLPVAGQGSQSSESGDASVPGAHPLETIKVEEDSDIEILEDEQAAVQEAPAPPQPTPAMSGAGARRLQELLAELSTYPLSDELTDGLTKMIVKELAISPRTIRFQWPYNKERNTYLYLENKTDFQISYHAFSNMTDRIVPFNGTRGVIEPGCYAEVGIKHLSFVYEKQENVGEDKIVVEWSRVTDGKAETGLIRQKEVPVVYMDKEE